MQDSPVYLVPVEDILVEDRFRVEYEGPDGNQKIAFLAESISKYGLLSPLVLDRDKNRLLAGGRRLEALKSLKWTLAPVLYRDQLTDLQRKEIELEENIARKDMTPVERGDLVSAIDQLKRQIYGSRQSGAVYQKSPDGGPPVRVETSSLPPDEDAWSLRRTADLFGTSVFSTHRDIVISNTVKVLPSLRNEKSAANILRKADHLVEDLERELEFRQQQQAGVKLDSNILLGDAIDLIAAVPTASVDCIITDPPYGLGLEKGRYAARDRTDTGFTDDDSILGVLDILAPELRRVLKPSGHLYAFFGASVWSDTICIYQNAGFQVSPIVCIWYKLGPATGAGDWDHSFAPAWEPFLFCTERTRRLAYKHKNVFEAEAPSGTERVHPTQKPLVLLEELIKLSTDPGDLILDPFAGAGSTLVAAKAQGRRYLGFELNDRYVEITKQRLL